MAGPTIEIQAPPRQRRLGGIAAIATFRTNERLAAAEGAVYQTQGCSFPQVSEHLCYVGEEEPSEKVSSGITLEDAIGAPFPLYAAVACTTSPDPDELARATRILDEGKDRALEEALATWSAGGTALAAGGSVQGAIAIVEQELDDSYVGRGVIMMSRADLIRADAAGVVKDKDGIPTTIAGTPVLASGRVTPGTIHGLGAIAVEHSTTDAHETLDPTVNQHYALAEAVYLIAVDCEFRVKSSTTS